jgi:hypothetical protein
VSAEVRELVAKTKRRTDLEIIGLVLGKGTGLAKVADVVFDVDDRGLQPDDPRAVRFLERVALRV